MGEQMLLKVNEMKTLALQILAVADDLNLHVQVEVYEILLASVNVSMRLGANLKWAMKLE